MTILSVSTWLTVDIQARERAFQWIKEIYESITIYLFNSEDNEIDHICYEPSWIPDGFSLVDNYQDSDYCLRVYANDTGEKMFSVEYTLMQHTSMSTTAQEYSEVVKVDINGIPADLYIGNETSPEKALIWVDEANQGACAQPCRWKYRLMEETRPGQYFPVEEHDEGTYIMNAKDLCMIDHIPELLAAGVDSLKLEGRAKSSYYVAVVTNAYRSAVDAYLQQPEGFVLPEWIREEVYKVSHRGYCTGFFFGKPESGQRYTDNSYDRSFDVIAIADDWRDGMLYVTQRNRFFAEDTVELLAPEQQPISIPLNGNLFDETGERITVANHAMMACAFPCPVAVSKGTIVRKRAE